MDTVTQNPPSSPAPSAVWIRVLTTLAAVMFCIQVFSDNKADVDLWGNAGFVRALPHSPGFLRVNTSSFTDPAQPWINHEWLAQYVLRTTFLRLGNPGLLALKVLIGLAVMLLLNRAIRRTCRSTGIRFLLLLLCASTMGYGFSTRPHLFTYLGFAGLLTLLAEYPKTRRWFLFIFPVGALFWVNLHGAFFIGIVTILVYLAIEAIRGVRRPAEQRDLRALGPLAIAVILFAGVSLVNPYGIRLWQFIAESAVLPRPYLSEWAPFHPVRDLVTHPDFVVLVILSACALLSSRTPRNWTWWTLLAMSLGAALILRRNIPLFAITAAFVIPPHLDDLAGETIDRSVAKMSHRLLACVLTIGLILSATFTLTFNKQNPLQIEVDPARFPVRTVTFMRDHNVRGNLLAFFDWAEYCTWHLYPGCRVFMDGRFSDAYRLSTIRDYLAFIYRQPGWEKALTDYPTDIVLIHVQNPIYAEMRQRPDWRLVYEADSAALFLKVGRHGEILDSVPYNTPPTPTKPSAFFFP